MISKYSASAPPRWSPNRVSASPKSARSAGREYSVELLLGLLELYGFGERLHLGHARTKWGFAVGRESWLNSMLGLSSKLHEVVRG